MSFLFFIVSINSHTLIAFTWFCGRTTSVQCQESHAKEIPHKLTLINSLQLVKLHCTQFIQSAVQWWSTLMRSKNGNMGIEEEEEEVAIVLDLCWCQIILATIQITNKNNMKMQMNDMFFMVGVKLSLPAYPYPWLECQHCFYVNEKW